ncbi:putative lyase [Symmachiella dynata]|nr:putative lyase [Symmachiella dynata]
MIDVIDPKDDPRTVDDLMNAALIENDEDIYWQAVTALHFRGTKEVLVRAEELCASRCAEERMIGADILGQLGVPDRTFPRESSRILRSLLKHDQVAGVLETALIGLSHHDDADTVPLAVRFSTHPDPEVRHAAVLAMTGYEVPLAIESLIELSNDPVAHVRDWATFALGAQIDLNTPEIRDALARRLEDVDSEPRAEALKGLARRHDERVIVALKRELAAQCIDPAAIEAAEILGSKVLHSHLIALRERPDVDAELLERAIAS